MKQRLDIVISGVFIFVIGSILAPAQLIQPVYALNGYIDPNADGSTASWTSTGTSYYTEINEAIRQPTTPTTTDYISGQASKSGVIYQNMNTISGAFDTNTVTI